MQFAGLSWHLHLLPEHLTRGPSPLQTELPQPTVLCCIAVATVSVYRAHSTFAPCGSQHSDEDIVDQSWYCRVNFNGLWVSAVVKDWG